MYATSIERAPSGAPQFHTTARDARAGAVAGVRTARCARACRTMRLAVLAALVALAVPTAAAAQGARILPAASAPSGAPAVDTAADTAVAALVARALEVNPTIIAARQRVRAAAARISPAGLPPDPMLMAGVQNLPLTRPGYQDFMTMNMVGVSQTLPYPGKLGLRRRAAALERDAASFALDAAERTITRDVRSAYYQLAFLDQAFGIVQRNRDVLAGFIRLTQTRYGVGSAGQQDVLRAQVEATRLAETAVMLTEQQRAALARLNALLDRESDTPVERPAFPARLARAAVARSADSIRFASTALGARAAGSPFRPVAELQALAASRSPELRAADAAIAAATARLELARRDYLPDPALSLQYGQRPGFPDMVTATVSVPLPLFKGRKQDQLVAEAAAQVAALQADRRAQRNAIDAEVARLISELERQRAQLALYVKALLPQGRASLASATASYQVGNVEFLTVLDNQATIFNYETEYFRVLADFATNVAELERLVGAEVIQ